MQVLINTADTSQDVLAAVDGIQKTIQLPARSRTVFNDNYVFVELGAYVQLQGNTSDFTYSYLNVKDAILGLPVDAATGVMVYCSDGFAFTVNPFGNIATLNGNRLSVYTVPNNSDHFLSLVANYAQTIIASQEILLETQNAFSNTLAIYGQIQALNPVSKAMTYILTAEATAMAANTTYVTFRLPHDFTLVELRLGLTTAGVGGNIQVDLLDSTNAVVASAVVPSGQTTSFGVGSNTISIPNLTNDQRLTLKSVSVGTTTAARGCKAYLIGYATPIASSPE